MTKINLMTKVPVVRSPIIRSPIIKSALSAMVLAVFVLTACGPAPTAEPTPTNTPAPTATTAAEPVEPPVTVEAIPAACEATPLPDLPTEGLNITITEDDWTKGASGDDVQLTIIEYSDFQCPACASADPAVQSVVETTPGVQLVYRHLPLESIHDKAFLAAEASEAAGAQGKFWEMHAALFNHAIQSYIAQQNQQESNEWIDVTVEDAPAKFIEIAEEIGLDVEQFEKDLAEGSYTDKVSAQMDEFAQLGLPFSTPTLIVGINGVFFKPEISSYDELVYFLAVAKMKGDDFTLFDVAPEMNIAEENTYQATLETSQGDIVLELNAQTAPTHVNSFIFLAQQNWYDGSDFFFVRDNFVALTGDPTNTTFGYPGYYCDGEKESAFDEPGTVGVLPNGQFFITLGSDAAQLNGQFTEIGRVVEGMEILDGLARVMPRDPTAPQPDALESVTITEK